YIYICKSPQILKSLFPNYSVALLAFLAAFSHAFVSIICLRKRMDSGVISRSASSFKNSRDSSNVICVGFLIVAVWSFVAERTLVMFLPFVTLTEISRSRED